MRILIDILHPAHVHFFKHFRTEMKERGHEVLVTAREKDIALDLLQELDIPHEVISTQRTGLLGMAGELAQRSWRLARIARRFRPDVLTGIMGVSIAPVGRLLRIPSVVFYDTEFAARTNRFIYPMATAVCTPDCYEGSVRGRHVTYPGYHELAYLHPSRFTPDRSALGDFGLAQDEPFSILRFVSWEASHDVGEKALSAQQKTGLVATLERFGSVLISSEAPLPPDLRDRQLTGPTSRIHDLVGFAKLLVGESATMASEAAVLGTPSVFIATSGRGYISDQEHRYGLTRWFQPEAFGDALAAVNELGEVPAERWAEARAALLNDKIDLTPWQVDFFTTEFG
ncbi:MAG: DUF354 domain-containing protein [Acidimicrobiia bacterium]|nr:DUF354 domain-containing protein [Acidimicrobiia bacterium]